MTTPLPSRRVRGSATGRPIMALLDLLGRRMALRILWELRDGAPHLPRPAGRRPRPTPACSTRGSGELREARIVEHGPEGYGADAARPRRCSSSFLPLHVWADEWARLLEGGRRKRRGRSKQA